MREFIPDGDTLRRFMASTAPVNIIQGPIGSGKTLACCMKGWMKALAQKPQRDGKRRCRGHVFRDSYPKLEETTLKTWLEWFPEKEFGRFYWSKPMVHEIRLGDIEMDVHFIALEDERAADYFRSLETTWCWFNEIQYQARLLFDEAVSRAGRYPRQIDGGAEAVEVFADMNAPEETHWIPIMRGDVAMPEWFSEEQRRAHAKPPQWKFFVQPPGLIEEADDKGNVTRYVENPKAENLKYLPKGYYLNAIQGKSKSWIDANVLNRVSARKEGKPVYAQFRRDAHVAKEPIKPIPGVEIIVGNDFGRSPAATFWQHLRGRWYCLHELIAFDMGANQFGPLLKAELAQKFPGLPFKIFGDPSGDFKGQNDENTPFQIYRSIQLPIYPAPSNLITVRLQAFEAPMIRMQEGKPCMSISPTCTTLIAALDGGYHFRRIMVSGERYAETPEKDQYSNVADSGQYALLGGGEGRILLTGSSKPAEPRNTRKAYQPFRAGRAAVRGW
jgi:hypothetical protein